MTPYERRSTNGCELTDTQQTAPHRDFEQLLFGALGIFWLGTGYYISALILGVSLYVLLSPGELGSHLIATSIIILGVAILLIIFHWLSRAFIERRFRRLIIPGVLILAYSVANVIYGINNQSLFDDRFGSLLSLMVALFTLVVIVRKRGIKAYRLIWRSDNE